jgi:hypothetical protein
MTLPNRRPEACPACLAWPVRCAHAHCARSCLNTLAWCVSRSRRQDYLQLTLFAERWCVRQSLVAHYIVQTLLVDCSQLSEIV